MHKLKKSAPIVFVCLKFSQYIIIREGYWWQWSQAATTNVWEVSASSPMSTTKKSVTGLRVQSWGTAHGPGSQMYVGDYLSRAYLKPEGTQPHDEFQVFAIELE